MKRSILLAMSGLVFSHSVCAMQCLSEFDDDYHQSNTVSMCNNITNFFIGGLTQQLQQPVRDKVIVQNVYPANATAYVQITPNLPLIMDGQMMAFTIPMVQGQCLDLISTYGHNASPASFSLKLVDGANSAVTADFDYEVGSGC